jgi:prophage antirepressor-like protein
MATGGGMDIHKFLKEVLTFGDKEIKMVGTKDEPWFCGKDVCEAMEYRKYRDALAELENKDKNSLYELMMSGVVQLNWTTTQDLNNETKACYISEKGLYDLALKSRKPAAAQFKDWITGEVLPSLRKTGKYEVKSNQDDMEALRLYFEEQLRIKDEEHQHQLKEKDDKIKDQEFYIRETNRHNQLMNELLIDNTKIQATQVIYIATTDRYALENKFKVGGIESCHKVDNRLGSYNTGRPKDDQMYFSDLILVVNYKQIEDRIKTLISRFRDTAKKEMYLMHYTDIQYVVKYCCEHYNEEVDHVNEHLDQFINNLNRYKLRPVVPPPAKCNFTTITQCEEDGSVHTQILEGHSDKVLVQNLLAYIASLQCAEISKKEVFDKLKVRGKRKQLLPLVQSAFRLKRPDITLMHQK